jgi:hypothetical protein
MAERQEDRRRRTEAEEARGQMSVVRCKGRDSANVSVYISVIRGESRLVNLKLPLFSLFAPVNTI